MLKVALIFTIFFAVVYSTVVPHPQFQAFSHRRIDYGTQDVLTFSIDNNTVAATGLVTCPNSTDDDGSITVTIATDTNYILTAFRIYINGVGVTQVITPYQYGKVQNNATNGYSFDDCNLHTIGYNFTVPAQVVQNITGYTCYNVEVSLDLKTFCGSYPSMAELAYSPPGCDVEFQIMTPSYDSYANIIIEPNTVIPGWCVNPNYVIYSFTPYQGEILSTYDPKVVNSTPGEYIAEPQNLDLLNYLFNRIDYYESAEFANTTGEHCTPTDVQNAIWTIVDPASITADPSLLMTPYNPECVKDMVNDAHAHGEGYIPKCPGGKYAYLVVPTISDCNTNCTPRNDTQITAFVQGGPCLTNCNFTYCHYPNLQAGANCSQCAPSSAPSLTSYPVITSSPTPSISKSSSNSRTSCPSVTSTATVSVGPSVTSQPVIAPSESASSSASSSYTPTSSISLSSTSSISLTSTPSISLSSTGSISLSSTSSISLSSTPSISESATTSISESSTPSISLSSTGSISLSSTPSTSLSSTGSISLSSTPSISLSSTGSISLSSTSSISESSTSSISESATSSISQSATPSISKSSSNSATSCASVTSTASLTLTPSISKSSSNSATSCASVTSTASYSVKPSVTSEPVFYEGSYNEDVQTAGKSRSPEPSRPVRPSQSRRPH